MPDHIGYITSISTVTLPMSYNRWMWVSLGLSQHTIAMRWIPDPVPIHIKHPTRVISLHFVKKHDWQHLLRPTSSLHLLLLAFPLTAAPVFLRF